MLRASGPASAAHELCLRRSHQTMPHVCRCRCFDSVVLSTSTGEVMLDYRTAVAAERVRALREDDLHHAGSVLEQRHQHRCVSLRYLHGVRPSRCSP